VNKKKLLQSVLSNTKVGELTLITPDDEEMRFVGDNPGEKATMIIKDWGALSAIVTRRDIGLGESYMEGMWESPDLKAFLTFCQHNREKFMQLAKFDFVNGLISRLRRLGNKNSLEGSKSNISVSYDHPPGLYQAYCDKRMTYSSGWWDGREMSYDEAQLNKYNRILSRLPVAPANILEMGCGWGYFLQLAAERGYTITGCTISRQQYEYAKELNKDAIADGRVELYLEDYRNMKGQYDAVVSTGFFEHVGSEYWVEHFKKVNQYLKPGGVAMIQTMLCNRFDPADGKRLSFVTKYIFPGGEFPSIGSFIEAAEEAGLKCDEHLAFGQDYARTMVECWNNYQKNIDDVRALGYDEVFIREWEFFLALWYSMFRSGQYNVMQAKLEAYP